MGPAYLNEYEIRAEYYDNWLKEQIGEENFPDDKEERHRLIVELREQAYQTLCDAVYEEKGYDLDGVPLLETVEKFDLLDDRALALLSELGVSREEKVVSN
jgi:aldehyde:ferredoxin oxidoreductase